MLNWVDNFLNRITMYRLVLYYLIILLAIAVLLSFFGLLSYSPYGLLFSALVLTGVAWVTNKLFASVFRVAANVESVYITALILALIITPPQSTALFAKFGFLVWAAIWAVAAKFILARRGKHFFNPAAFAVALTSFTIIQSASWWIGNSQMMIFALIGGLLVVRKLQRFDLVLSYLAVAFATITATSFASSNVYTIVSRALLHSPMLFFASIMLTEPLTTPPTRRWRIIYGAVVGFLFAPAIHIGPIYSTPELALLAGNIFSYAVSPKYRYMLTLKNKNRIGNDIYDFVFRSNWSMKFRPGQYLEWTLGHAKPDTRGNRRYFTLASSPTERDVHLGVKFYQNSSTFKRTMLAMRPGSQISASQLSGDFTLPKDPSEKLVLIAGGIGITPFRSMLKYLVDRGEKRPIILFYSNKKPSEIAYSDIFAEAGTQLGIKTVYTLTDARQAPADWPGYIGHFDPRIIAAEVPDWRERTFYLSGPRGMVMAFEKTLKQMGVTRLRIKTDFFPGFA